MQIYFKPSFMSKESKRNKRQKRVSFHPNLDKEDVERTDIDVDQFQTQKFDEHSMIQAFDKRRVNGRMSLNPIGKVDFYDENDVKKEKKALSNFKEKPRRNTIVDDFMYDNEIRFIDKIISNCVQKGFKSDSSTEMNSLYMNKYFYKPRVEWLKNVIKMLTDQMGEFQEKIDAKQKMVDVERLDLSNLKKIRNWSRNKSKFEWYAYRRVHESNFIKNMIENEQKMEVEKNERMRKLKETETEIERIRNEIEMIEVKNEECNVFIGDRVKLDEDSIEDLKYRIMNQMNKKELIENEEEKLKGEVFNKETTLRVINGRIKNLTADIEMLDARIVGKNATEAQFNELQNLCSLYESIINLQLINVTKNKVQLKFCNFEFTFIIGEDTTVKDFFVVKTDKYVDTETQIFDSFYLDNMLEEFKLKSETNTCINNDEKFIKGIVTNEKKKRFSVSNANESLAEEYLNTLNFNNTLDLFMLEKCQEECKETVEKKIEVERPLKLKEYLLQVIYKYHVLNTLRKDILLLKERCKIESFYIKNKIYWRVYLNAFKTDLDRLDLSMDSSMYLIHEKQKVIDLKSDLQGLSMFVASFIK